MGNTNVKPHPKPRTKKQVRWKAADRPAPPGRPSLVEENGSIPDVVHIGWTKPVKDGGSTVTSYLVEHRRVGTTHWLQSSAQPVLINELIVNGLQQGWRYQFRVRAQNAVGLSDPSEISEPFTVTLQRSAIAAPKFTQELQDTVALEKDKVDFEIHFLGQPLPNICWFKDGFEIFSGNRTRITTVSDKSVLTILQASVSDEGEIKCTATNRAGHTITKCRLNVDAPPSIILPKSYQDPDGIIFEIGESIKMNVTVSGKPTPLIFWSHDGESIDNNDRYEIEYVDKIASVKIENASRSDRGEYRIKAVNKLGQDQASFLVTITDKPTPPGRARVLLTSGRSVTLSWSTPEDDGGCRVGNYIIEYYRLGWDVWLKAATTRQLSTMLGDLIEGSQYKFRVKAESPYGVSDPSEESEVVFIPDVKRGIEEQSDLKNFESGNQLTLSKRRRANSTPRVSFVLNEDVPVRPERKKTGKTPEASPRFKRRQFPISKINLGSEPSLNRKFSIPYSLSSSSTNTSWSNSPIRNLQDIPSGRTTIIKVEKHKSPSPEIIITDADSNEGNQENSSLPFSTFKPQEKSPSTSPIDLVGSNTKSSINLEKSPPRIFIPIEKPAESLNQFQKSPSISPEDLDAKQPGRRNRFSRSPSLSPQQFDKSPPRSPDDLQKKSLIFSGNEPSQKKITNENKESTKGDGISEPWERGFSEKNFNLNEASELVKNENTNLEKNMKFSGNDTKSSSFDRIRPPLTHQAFSGSSEFMLVLCPEGEQGTRFKKFGISFDENSIPPPLSLSAPELGIELPEQPSMKRSASSTELLTYRFMERLQNAEINDNLVGETKTTNANIPEIQVNSQPAIEKLKEDKSSLRGRHLGVIPNNQTTWLARRHSLKNAKEMSEILGVRLHKFEDTEQIRREVLDYRRISETEQEEREDGKEEWLQDYEESIPSEEESESAYSTERRTSEIMNSRNDIEDDEEETYSPRNRMLIAGKQNDDRPFEILTVRKNPPNSNIVPKPILKKKSPNRTVETVLSEEQYKIFRSNSLGGATDEDIDVSRIKTSPTPEKRRSFSLMPSQASFITNALKSKGQKIDKTSESDSKFGMAKNVSALANFTSIAGAGFVLPNEMKDKKETEEEAKVVVDFYGDIVKSFGGRSKPIAEFSRSAVSKYDTYEERKISDIKPNADSLAGRPNSPKMFDNSSTRQTQKSQNDVSHNSIQEAKVRASLQKNENLIPALRNTNTNQSNETAQIRASPKTDVERFKIGNYNHPKETEKYLPEVKYSPLTDERMRQLKAELAQNSIYQKEHSLFGNLQKTEVTKTHRDKIRVGRSGSRTNSINKRRKTPMSRDASTSPVRFSDDWDSQCSSKTSLEQDYYNRGSMTSSRASSLSRRSLSPTRPKLRGITTQTSFRIEQTSPVDSELKKELVKKAEERVSFLFGYFTDAAMVGVAGWLYIFQNEYLAIPFIVIPIYRQLADKMKTMNDGIKRRLPRWIRRRFEKNS